LNPTEPTTRTTDDDLDFLTLCRIGWRQKYVIIAVVLCSAAAAVAYALTAQHIFRGEAVIAEVQNNGAGAMSGLASQIGGLASLAGVNLSMGNAAGPEAQAILRSRHLAEEFVKRNGLTAELLRDGGTDAKALWVAVEAFRNSVLQISDDKRAGTVTVSMDWTDPAKVASWANGYVALANEFLRQRALNDASRNIKYLREQAATTNVVELQNVMYRLIESETKTLMLANGRGDYAFTVVDPAVVPEQRVKPRRRLILMVGLSLGFIIGVLAGLVRERFTASS
jgi:uncharacterized protein involved in exopolysaccharide biosynthesis